MESEKLDKREKSVRPPSADRVEARGTALLLDRALPPGYLSEWTGRIAARSEVSDFGTQSVVIFRIGKEWLALPTRVFREVTEDCPFHSLPHRGGHIATGLVTVRGEILTCVSLETLLGLEPESRTEERKSQATYARVALVDRGGNRFAFPVSEVCLVVRYHPRELQEVPTTLAHATAAYTLGLLPWQGHTVGCLDDELLFYTVNKGLA
jgi:chemotaxis-related protein WspD